MRKIVRELELISDTFDNNQNSTEATQLVKISNLGLVQIVKLNSDGKIINRQRQHLDKSIIWRIFDLIDENFELTTSYPENFDYGFWSLRLYYNKALTGEYHGPLMNLDNLGQISNSLRSMLDRDDLNLFDGQGIAAVKKKTHFNLLRTSTELAKSYLNEVLQRKKIRIARILLNNQVQQVYCRCDDRQINSGMMVWAKIDHKTVVGKVTHILFIKPEDLPIEQNQINIIVSKY